MKSLADDIQVLFGVIITDPMRKFMAYVQGYDFYINYEGKVIARRDIKEGEEIKLSPEQHNIIEEEKS